MLHYIVTVSVGEVSDRSVIIEHWWIGTDGKTEVLPLNCSHFLSSNHKKWCNKLHNNNNNDNVNNNDNDNNNDNNDNNNDDDDNDDDDDDDNNNDNDNNYNDNNNNRL